MADFVHLRVHSEYSIADGLVQCEALMKKTKQLGMSAVALTDLVNLFAAIKFYKAAVAEGIKPILGADLLIEAETGSAPFELTLLCQSPQGYQHLMVLISKAYLEGSRYQGLPLVPKAWLCTESVSGLIALSGAQQGDIGRALLSGNTTLAKSRLEHWLSIFPNQRFYLEIQRTGRALEQDYIQAVLPLASLHRVPVVATGDVRFLNPDQFTAHEIRVAIHEGNTLDDPARSKRYSPQQYLASPEVMASLFADLPEAIANSVHIAQRCTTELILDKPQLPTFQVPEAWTEASFLEAKSQEGFAKRFPPGMLSDADRERYQARLAFELNVITSMGFSGYFLIVSDFIQFAKQQDIPVGPGRGSGAGSLVAYVLEITGIDPLPYDLLFERFLNPERVSMPDFDIDFCIEGRDRVIDYVAHRSGRDRVSQIATFGTMAAKAVIRDVGRVLALPYGFVDSIAKLIPFEVGMTLEQALQDEPLLKARYEKEEDVRSVIEMGLQLEGTVRNVGKHAGGVVIAPSSLTDFCPIYCEEGSTQLVAQYDKNDVEAVGLVKFDFLGLRNLTIIHETLRLIAKARLCEAPIDMEKIPLDDLKTFELLKRGDTTAIFQLESRGMKDLIKRLQPDTFEEIIALVALFRPGPLQSGMVEDFIDRKHGRSEVIYPHPDLVSVLTPTYGVMLYQEQVMLIAQILGGYSLGGADLLRRAMGKKKPEEMARQRSVFIQGALSKGASPETASSIFDLMEKFSGYGFNKPHAAAYALIAYQTAWLKAHYPVAFMSAVLSSDMDNTDKIVIFIAECKHLGLEILPPDINESAFKFSVKNGKICYGLGAIKGVGEQATQGFFEERDKAGPFKSLFDFCERTIGLSLNHRVMEALIDSGAFDTFKVSRESLHASLDKALQLAEQARQNKSSGQSDLFEEFSPLDSEFNYVEVPPCQNERLFREKAVLGYFLSEHPLSDIQERLKAAGVHSLEKMTLTERHQTVSIAVLLTQLRRLKTKRGDWMAILTLEDAHQKIEATVFSDALESQKEALLVNQILICEVEVNPPKEGPNFRVNVKKAQLYEQFLEKRIHHFCLHLKETDVVAERLVTISELIAPFKGGACPLSFFYPQSHFAVNLIAGDAWKIRPAKLLIDQLSQLLGTHQVRYEL